jgi:predicted RNase H-like nuclease
VKLRVSRIVAELSLVDVIGVDGCASGWIAASRDARGAICCRHVNALADLFGNSIRPRVVAVDVPIGLLGRGARDCDVEARRLLGARRSSVFPAPIRPILTATSQAAASRIRRRIEGKGVSIQTWAIAPKIVEVDGFLRADDVRREIVREVHPEVSFFFLNGQRPMNAAKRKADGQAERLSVLRKWGGEAIGNTLAKRKDLACKADDIVDALVALWTAERIACGTAILIPSKPPLDAYGLRMEMVA